MVTRSLSYSHSSSLTFIVALKNLDHAPAYILLYMDVAKDAVSDIQGQQQNCFQPLYSLILIFTSSLFLIMIDHIPCYSCDQFHDARTEF